MMNTVTDEPVVSLKDVSFAYDSVPVLEHVSLSIAPREWACMVGPNGGGKTTLLRLMLGLLRADEGEVSIFGRPPRCGAFRIGYMPQHLHYDPQFPVTVTDVVLMGRLGRDGFRGRLGWYDKEDRRAVLEALGEVEMESLALRPFAALSGGQRQRVLIARALCGRPDLLLLDEPTTSVDPRGEAQLLDILQKLNRRMTIVTVSHDLGFVSDVVQSVICVNRRVVIHPTSEMTGDVIRDIYGGDVRMVRHDHRCSQQGHTYG